jgi:hypothetical protein
MNVSWNPVRFRFIKSKRRGFSSVLESAPLSRENQSRLNSDLLMEQYVDEGVLSLRMRVWAPFIAVFVVSYLVLSSHTHRVTTRRRTGGIEREAAGLKGRY